MRKMMAVVIGRVKPLAGRKMARKRGGISTGVVASPVAIAATAMIMGDLKMKVSAE